MSDPYDVKYRPECLCDVIGQESVIKSIEGLLKSKDSFPHAFLFSGESGVGKTTIGRIIGWELGCSADNIMEIDGATYTGIDAIKSVCAGLEYVSISNNPIKFVIIDECFAKGTLVNTTSGKKSIETIQVGDNVYNMSGIGKVQNTFKNKIPLDRVVKVIFKGRSIICSQDHEFFTDGGWVKAKDLKNSVVFSSNPGNRCYHQFFEGERKGRWERIQQEREFLERQKKGEEVGTVRVEDIEVYKRGDNDRSFKDIIGDKERDQGFVEFYDLEVSNHPSYYADDVLVHNCHSLSSKAWDSMLKIIEEPPEHVYFVFCTTLLNKVPRAIKTRCTSYNLKPVGVTALQELLEYVIKEEDLKLNPNIIDLIAREAKGSPREALNFLSKCRDCRNTKEVSELLETFENESDIHEICKMLSGSGSWGRVRDIVKNLDIADYSGARIQIFNYLTACVVNARSEEESVRFLDKLDKFSKPYYIQQTSKGEFLLSLGDIFL